MPEGLARAVGSRPLVTAWVDDGLALLGEQLDEPLLLADQVVDLGGFAVEVFDD
jgi:hypothetical protein